MSGGIVVLGMHRSGTSLVAELAHRWGAFGRIKECLPSNQWNARGYWELAPLVDFNNRLLQTVGATWSFPPSQRDDLRLSDLARQQSYRDEAVSLLASMKSDQERSWFWKDPRLSLLLPFWQSIWGGVRYVICVRNPIEICRSLQQRDNLSFSVSIMLWQRYMLSILERTRSSPVLVMSYSKVLQNPVAECARLSDFLQDPAQPHDCAAATSEMRKVIDRELRHCKASAGSIPVLLTKRQRELHETLERMADCDAVTELNLEPFSLPRAWRGLLRANLLWLRCQHRWNRMFLHLADLPDQVPELNARAISRASSLESVTPGS